MSYETDAVMAKNIAEKLRTRLPQTSPEDRAALKLVRMVCQGDGILPNNMVVRMWLDEQHLFSETCDYTSLVGDASRIVTDLIPNGILIPRKADDGTTYLILAEIESTKLVTPDLYAIALRILQANEANIALEQEELGIWVEHQRAEHSARKKRLENLINEQKRLQQLLR